MSITNNSEQPISWSATLAAVTLFLLLGLGLIFSELPHEWMLPSWFRSIAGYFLLGEIVLLPIGLCIAWIRDFPRWSYPYFGQVLLFSLYMMNVATPGFLFDRELWGWRAWIPFLVVAVVSFLVTRSFHPLQRFFTNIRDDWTHLTFGMFGFMPLMITIIFDEMDRLYSLYFMVILTFLMAGTAVAYMLNSNNKGRVKALLIGVFLTTATAVAGPAWFWLDRVDSNPIPTVIAGIVVFMVMFSPAMIGLFVSLFKRSNPA